MKLYLFIPRIGRIVVVREQSASHAMDFIRKNEPNLFKDMTGAYFEELEVEGPPCIILDEGD